VGRDITDRKRLEARLVQAGEALAERQRELSTLMNNLPGMVYRCLNDPDGTIIFASRECRKLTGYAGDNLPHDTKLSFKDFVHPDDQPRVWDETGRALDEGVFFIQKPLTVEGLTTKVREILSR
jgi:PAS domain-containing protein